MVETLGKYELRGTLGKGAMGTVYEGWDPVIERKVAIKTIRLPATGEEEMEEEHARFKREAQAAGRLSHHGIVGVYDYGDTGGVAYIAMELVEGQSLKHLLDQEQRLTPGAAISLMKELLDALAYSHARGVIHRDIKPTNILVTSTGALKITDFGIARIESSSMTQLGTVMGTPAYMSPEQFMGQTVDQRTDIYAAGVLLFQLLTGERPFEGGLTAIMHKVLHTTPPRPSDLSVTAPPWLDAVVAKAMARRPEDRYATAKAFAAALDAGAPSAVAAPENDDHTLVMPSSAARPPPRAAAAAAAPTTPALAVLAGRSRGVGPVAWGGLAAVVLLGLAGGGWFLMQPSAPAARVAPPVQVATAGSAIPPSPAPAPPQLPLPVPSVPAAAARPEPVAPPIAAIPALPRPSTPPAIDPASAEPAPSATQTMLASNVPSQPPAVPEAAPVSPARAPIDVPCTLIDAVPGPDGRVTATGWAGAGGPESAARAAVAATQRSGPVNWRVTPFDGPYCGLVDALRSTDLAARPEVDGFDFSLRGGTNHFRNGQIIAPKITAPTFPSHLLLSYFQSDGTVVHLVPTKAAPDHELTAGAPVAVGDRATGGWPAGDPFGADMMLAIASSAPLPLPARPDAEKADGFIAALHQAIAAAQHSGVTVLARIVPIQTTRR